MGFAHFLYKVLWAYSFLTLALISAVALTPVVLLVREIWSYEVWMGVSLAGEGTAWYGYVLRAFFMSFALTSGYFLFGLTLILLVAILRILMGLRSKEDEIPIPSLRLWTWYHYDGLLLFVGNVFGPMLRGMSVFNVYLRIMGAKIGRNVIVNSNKVYDHDLLEIGENTIIGGDVIIIGHVAEGRRLVRRRVKIGKNCTIGQLTSIFPGARIGDNVVIGAHTLVPKNADIPSDTVWGGVPARQLRGPPPAASPPPSDPL